MFKDPYPFCNISILLVKHIFRLDSPLSPHPEFNYCTHMVLFWQNVGMHISVPICLDTCGMFSIFLHTNDINQVSTDGKIICITKKSSSDVHGNMRYFCLGWLGKATVGIEDFDIKGFVIVPQRLYTKVLNLHESELGLEYDNKVGWSKTTRIGGRNVDLPWQQG